MTLKQVTAGVGTYVRLQPFISNGVSPIMANMIEYYQLDGQQSNNQSKGLTIG
jgi:hypothetical protein